MAESQKEIVLVTGATSGIGRATALMLARGGHRVFATGRRQNLLDSLAAEAKGLQLETLVLDVSKAESIAAAKAEIDRRTGGHGVDAVVNNAGYGQAAPLAEIADTQLRAQFETNVFGLMAVTRAFLPAMLERRAGRVVNVSSVGGKVTFPLLGAYNATKHAVESLSDALRVELKPLGVQVSIIEPGAIATEFNDVSVASITPAAGSLYTEALRAAEQTSARFAKRAVGPEHVARAIAHAVTSRRPRVRYVVPFNANVILWLAKLLPTAWFDGMQARMMGLTAERMLPKS